MNIDTNAPVESVPEHWVRLVGEDTDESIDGFELFSARRALGLLKGKLGRERLLELLRGEIGAGDAFLRTNVERSGGQEMTGTTRLRAHGITAAQFTGWLARAFGREDVMLAGHPEHYSIHAEPGRTVNIVETLGEYVCSFFMREWDDSVVVEQTLRSGTTAKPAGRRSQMLLEDGTVVGSIANAFDEEPDGFTATLSVTLPATCGPDVIQQHLEHFAVEFRTWILRAAAARTGLESAVS
ncbi:hypothetical protein GU243_21660 [Pseudarthrobacter psychrotolerans]|uniref:Uncharacterized protein n=1 Tax=Pseudarthrobacter psychrotolerans TaxID=2697569 RepID=A0A6P1NTY0_9MICC|nr:hypothetical protein [Pseudarthrobacter psychrotolerans]QHK21840.1 hypothetical protein GU243_21660 [Pseudarthrobacter psychrotolerans]